ncbi:hypothetical protein [Bombella apis]|uniref:hypothetical protein n=1 Tax=Bombella apis TaxID=1785988 RepID=UPI0024A8244E|nr:hypothetical protein [Bombella apis]
MILSCSSPPVYGWVLTRLKDFGSFFVSVCSVSVSVFSYLLARDVSKITKRQKELNEKNYDLSLFKERFAVWNEFQGKRDILLNIGRFFSFDEHEYDPKKYRKDIFEVEDILKKINFLFIDDNSNRENDKIVESIKYNENLFRNIEKYREKHNDIEMMKEIYLDFDKDDQFYSFLEDRGRKVKLMEEFGYDMRAYYDFFNGFYKVCYLYDKAKKVLDYKEEFVINFCKYYNKHVSGENNIYDKGEIINIYYKERSHSTNKERIRIKLSTVNRYKRDMKELKKHIPSMEEEIKSWKEKNKSIMDELREIRNEIGKKIGDYEKECEEIYTKTNCIMDNICGEKKFFDSANEFMENHLKIKNEILLD